MKQRTRKANKKATQSRWDGYLSSERKSGQLEKRKSGLRNREAEMSIEKPEIERRFVFLKEWFLRSYILIFIDKKMQLN